MTPGNTADRIGSALHCPKCSGEMVSYERAGIIVDQCRDCRGVFLDRGELDRLLDAETAAFGGPGPGSTERGRGREETVRRRDDDDDDDDRSRFGPRGGWGRDLFDGGARSDDGGREQWSDGRPRPTKRRSLLGELFEGFGE